jgi:uncharacterized membrane protein YuzA (DUF378 family)
MICALALVILYVIGVAGIWATFVSVNPIFTRRDLLVTLIFGVVGPLSWVMFAITWCGGEGDRPIKWLSLGQRDEP